jgi:hypothetical protein
LCFDSSHIGDVINPLTGMDGFAKCLLLKIKALESPCINTSVSIHKLAKYLFSTYKLEFLCILL